MRLATFNTFWLGTPTEPRIRRADEDLAAIVQLLARLDADVILFQEVVNLPLLESLLARVRPGAYRLHDLQGNWLTTGRMRSRISHLQKLALAYDANVLELLEATRPFSRRWPGPREPLLARFRHRGTRFEFTLLGVHLKSGGLLLPSDSTPSRTREGEARVLVDWLRPPPGGAGPQTEAVIVMGDFNASREHSSLAALHALQPQWTWHAPKFEPDRAWEHWSSFGEKSVIDHVLTSPAATARVTDPAEILAFDLDPEFDRPRHAPHGSRVTDHFLRRRTDLWIQPDDDEPAALVENIYRISDHRPLAIGLR